MTLFTPRFLALGLLAGLALSQPARAQQAPRYIFPNTRGGVLALPNGQILLASTATGSRTLRLHWLNAQGDTVRGKRIVLPGTAGIGFNSVTANPHTGTTLIECGGRTVLLSALGDTLWTRRLNVPWLAIGTPDGGFVALGEGYAPGASQSGPFWSKISATGQQVAQIYPPLPAGIDYQHPVGIVPAASGCWLVLREQSSASTAVAYRAIQVSETGVMGAQLVLPVSGYGLSRIEALPNPADGYLALIGSRVQRFSPSWVAQWPAPVPGYDGMRVGPDGNALVFMAGPYARIPEAPLGFPIGVGQVTPQGQQLYANLIDEQMGTSGVGLDIAKNTAGSLIVHTAVRTTITTNTLLVYTLPAVALATKKTASAELAVYPQPATAAVTIRTAALQGQLTLLDGLGRVVRQLPVEAGRAEQQLPLQGLAAGIYVLRAADKAGRVLSTRISKQ